MSLEITGPTQTPTMETAMNSLRDMMETTFAAAAFGERGLRDEAQEVARGVKRAADAKAKVKGQGQRRRPGLNA
jgi:hypothetical protein